MSLEVYKKGYSRVSPHNDGENLASLLEKRAFYQKNPELGCRIEDPEHRRVIPQIVLQADAATWSTDVGAQTDALLALLEKKEPSEERDAAITALQNPEQCAFRAFRRTYWTKEEFRARGIDYDHDVVDAWLETDGAEYSSLGVKDPYYNMSIGELKALLFFRPYAAYADTRLPLGELSLLATTASSYLSIYKREGIENSGYFHSIKVTDGEPLARKRIATIRVDWPLPAEHKLPARYGV